MMIRLATVGLLLIASGCFDSLEAPGPEWKPLTYSEGAPNLSFSLRPSNISPGSVRFRNFSSGMLEFTWHFGFYDKDGYEVVSHTPAPTIRYPKNGRYNVRLKGLGTDSTEYWASDWVEINNMAN